MSHVGLRFGIALGWLLLLGHVNAAQRQSDAARLESGSLQQRHEALIRVLKLPPEQRDAQTLSAVAREVTRTVEIYRSGAVRGDARDAYFDYLTDLMQALYEARDPATIPVLLKVVGLGRYAIDSLVRCGDLSVPGLLSLLDNPQTSSDDESGAMFAFAYMLDGSVPGVIQGVSDENRRAIIAVAEESLHRRLRFGNVLPVTLLALATGRSDLRQELDTLATDSQAWIRRGLLDATFIQQSQGIIRVQLAKRPRR